jgi:hypothetical protein
VYEFSMDGAIDQVPDPVQFRDGFRQDIVHAVIVGPVGQMTASGVLLQAIGSQPYPACNPYARQCAQQPQVTAAAARFAALKAGRIPLARIP